MNLYECVKTNLKETDDYLSRLEEIRKSLPNDDAEGLDLVLDDLTINPETCALSDLEDAVHESVFKFNDANALDDYTEEDFYNHEYNANNIYTAIVKLYGRDKDIEKALGHRPNWLNDKEDK